MFVGLKLRKKKSKYNVNKINKLKNGKTLIFNSYQIYDAYLLIMCV